jgi:hypothetical protein
MSAPAATRACVRIEPAEIQRRDLRKCGLCEKGLMHTGLPLFYRVTIERFGVDAGAVRRLQGMEMYLGSPQLADVFSTGEPLAKPIFGPDSIYVCESCSMESIHCIAALHERMPAEPEEEAPKERVSNPTGGRP